MSKMIFQPTLFGIHERLMGKKLRIEARRMVFGSIDSPGKPKIKSQAKGQGAESVIERF